VAEKINLLALVSSYRGAVKDFENRIVSHCSTADAIREFFNAAERAEHNFNLHEGKDDV